MRRIKLSSVAPLCCIIVLHSISKDMIFEKKNDFEHKICVLSFSITCVWNIFRSKKNSARHWHKLHRSSRILFVILVIFSTNLSFLNRFSINPQNIKYHVSLSSGSRVVSCEQTDRHDEGNSRFAQHREFVWKGQNEGELLTAVLEPWYFWISESYRLRLLGLRTIVTQEKDFVLISMLGCLISILVRSKPLSWIHDNTLLDLVRIINIFPWVLGSFVWTNRLEPLAS